jgi:hypothetical protein
MIGTFLKRLLLLILFLALQVLVLNHVQILGYATPMICVYFILLFPLGTSRWQILIWGFLIGLLQDIFTNTPGMNAASLTLVAMIQPVILKTFSTRDTEDNEEALPPSAANMDWSHFLRYVGVAVIAQQIVFYLLEAFSFFNLFEMLINIGGGSLMSFFFIWALEGVRIGGAKKNSR